jgi:hypothetical protein
MVRKYRDRETRMIANRCKVYKSIVFRIANDCVDVYADRKYRVAIGTMPLTAARYLKLGLWAQIWRVSSTIQIPSDTTSIALRLVYRTSESTSFSKRHRYEILTSTCTAFYSALAARVFFNPPFKGRRSSSTCRFVISMIVAVDSSCDAFGWNELG